MMQYNVAGIVANASHYWLLT